jgi:hypothetical protein
MNLKLCVLAVGVSLLSACASAPYGATSKTAPAPTPAAEPAALSGAAAYQGKFASTCVSLVDNNINFIDMFTLTLVDDKTLSVGMQKTFYSSDDCTAETRIGSITVPAGRWIFEGQAKVGDRLVDKITVNLVSGRIVAKSEPGAKANGSIETVGDTIILHYGPKEKMEVSNQSAGGSDKDLRWLGKGIMLTGDPVSGGPDGYPQKLNEDAVFIRQ